MTMAAAPALTTDEYLRTPETVRPQELIFGALRVSDAPTPRHQSALLAFALALAPHVRARGLGRVFLAPVDVILDDRRHLIVQPDLVFISGARLPRVTDRIRTAPDMTLEVLSPNPRIGDLNERLQWFAEYGVHECWLFHQLEARLEIVTFADRAIADRHSLDETAPISSRVLPEFNLSVDDILRHL
jgi:Uma2 family endonuclease